MLVDYSWASKCSCCQTLARRGGNGPHFFPMNLDNGVHSIQRTVALREALTSWSWQPARVFPALATSCSRCWLCWPHSAWTAYHTSQHITRPRQDQPDPLLDFEPGQFNSHFLLWAGITAHERLSWQLELGTRPVAGRAMPLVWLVHYFTLGLCALSLFGAELCIFYKKQAHPTDEKGGFV